MAKHGFRNTTGSPITVGDWTIPAASASDFYDDVTKHVKHACDVYKSIVEEPTGVNKRLADGDLVYQTSGIDAQASDFYAFWSTFPGYVVEPGTDKLIVASSSSDSSSVFAASTNTGTVSNTDVESNIFDPVALTVASQSQGNVIEIVGDGSITMANALASAVFRIRLGGVEIWDSTVSGSDIAPSSYGVPCHWSLNTRLAASAPASSSSAMKLYGVFNLTHASGVLIFDVNSEINANTLVDNQLLVSVAWNTASAANTVVTGLQIVKQALPPGLVALLNPTTDNIRVTSGNSVLYDDFCIKYNGTSDVVFALPTPTGSKRKLRFIHDGSPGTWLYLDAAALAGTINNDTAARMFKYSTNDVMCVDIVDTETGKWNIVT